MIETMNTVVCVKYVPETAEVDLAINDTGKRLITEGFTFDINEWDNYALEEAVLLKEKLGGSVTAVTVGPEEADDMLRHCLARGADAVIRVTDKAFEDSDGYVTAKILHQAIKDLVFDLVLTGAQASDDYCAQVGPVLAQLLGIPHATMVKGIEPMKDSVRVHRELEGGWEEIVELELPALLTIETGINEPRYVSLRDLLRARKREVKVLGLSDVGLSIDEVGERGSWIRVERMFLPTAEKEVKMVKGDPSEASSTVIQMLRDRRVL